MKILYALSMEKNIEVELRALLPDLKQFEDALKARGATFLKSAYLCDIYFCPRSASSVEEVEMHDVGSYSLRLRDSRIDGKMGITLNTKTITNEGDHQAWEEHEVKVDSLKEAALVLLRTEFKPFFKLEKNRTIYTYDGMEISIEDISDFGGAVEIEIMSSPEEVEASKKKIVEFLSSVGIPAESIVPKSITNIIMKQRAFKQDITF